MNREDWGAETRLNTLLDDWAARHALPAATAEGIRRTIVQQTETETASPVKVLPVAWWHQVFGTLTTTLRQSTDARRWLPAVGLSS